MTSEEKLKAGFSAAFDPLHTSASARDILRCAGPRRRRLPRPAAVLALCLCLALACSLGVSAAGLLRQWPSLFGGPIREVEPPKGPEDFSFYATQEITGLPEGTVSFLEFDPPGELPDGEGSTAGVYELADGSIFLRRAGAAQDQDITRLFTGEQWEFLYNGTDGQAHTARVLGSYSLEYERLGETVGIVITQVRHTGGQLGYLLVRPGPSLRFGYLYPPETDFEAVCLEQLARLTA